MTESHLTSAKAHLERLLLRLPAQRLSETGLTAERASDPMDDLQNKQALDLRVAELSSLQKRRRELATAINRIALGDYGTCADCEEPIGAKWLTAVPWVTLCLACQEAQEEFGKAA